MEGGIQRKYQWVTHQYEAHLEPNVSLKEEQEANKKHYAKFLRKLWGDESENETNERRELCS